MLYFLWQAVQKYHFAKSQDNPHKNLNFQVKSGTCFCTCTNQGLSGMVLEVFAPSAKLNSWPMHITLNTLVHSTAGEPFFQGGNTIVMPLLYIARTIDNFRSQCIYKNFYSTKVVLKRFFVHWSFHQPHQVTGTLKLWVLLTVVFHLNSATVSSSVSFRK